MAIELYDSLNYLFILDHYDDITLFDLNAEPLAVSYYQQKQVKGQSLSILLLLRTGLQNCMRS